MQRFFSCFTQLSPVIVLFFIFHSLGIAQDGALQLQVVDLTLGVGIPEVLIICKNPQEQIVKEAKTDKSGMVTISLPEGSYTVYVEKQGAQHSVPITIKAGWETVQEIKLRQSAPGKQKVGIFPMDIRLGPPPNTNVFTFKMSNPTESSEFSAIQFVQRTISMEQFPHQIQSLKQYIWLQIEANVPYSQILSVLDILYRYHRTEQVYLSFNSSDDLALPIQPMETPMTLLSVVVDDYFARHQMPRIADAKVAIEGPKSIKHNTDPNGVIQFTQIPPGEYTVKVTKNGYQTQSTKILMQQKTMTGLFFHLVKTDTNPPEQGNITIQLPHDQLELKLPTATNMRMPKEPYDMLSLDRLKMIMFESGFVGQTISSVEQMKLAFSQGKYKRLLIAADETTESQSILSILKYATEAKFTHFRFVIQ